MNKNIILFLILFTITGMVFAQEQFVTALDLVISKETLKSISSWIWYNIWYKHDEDVWNKKDYWQSPEETLKLLSGDCEDFAILMWKCASILDKKPKLMSINYYKKFEKRCHMICLLGYSESSDICYGYFDNNDGLILFNKGYKPSEVAKLLYDDWYLLKIWKKKENNNYKKYEGWKIQEYVYR